MWSRTTPPPLPSAFDRASIARTRTEPDVPPHRPRTDRDLEVGDRAIGRPLHVVGRF